MNQRVMLFEALTAKEIAFADYWQNRWGHFEKLLDAEKLRTLVCLSDLDSLIVAGGLPHTDLQFIESGRAREVPRTRSIAPAVDVDLLVSLYDRGRSFRIQHLENHLPSVAQACRDLEGLFGFPVRCNAYIAPELAAGLAPHYDSSDSFIVQLHGSKGWDIYDGYTLETKWPLASDPFSAARHKPQGEPRSIKMACGDILYLPRGIMHRAYTTGASSIHLTFSILGYSWADALNQIIMLAGQQTDAMRALVPLGSYHVSEAADLELRALSLAQLIDIGSLFGDLIETWRAQFARHKPSMRPGAFEKRWMSGEPRDDDRP